MKVKKVKTLAEIKKIFESDQSLYTEVEDLGEAVHDGLFAGKDGKGKKIVRNAKEEADIKDTDSKLTKGWKKTLTGAKNLVRGTHVEDSVQTTQKDAVKEAAAMGITCGDPLHFIVQKHISAVKKAREVADREFKLGKEEGQDSFMLGNNCITGDVASPKYKNPKNNIMVISCKINMKHKKSKLGRLFSGDIKNIGTNIGVLVLKAYVKEFLGETDAASVTKDTVCDFVDADDNSRVGYVIAFKMQQEVKPVTESIKVRHISSVSEIRKLFESGKNVYVQVSDQG